MELNKVYYKSSTNMCEVDDCSVNLIITSPPYFNIKDYSKQNNNLNDDMGTVNDYEKFIDELVLVWEECFRVLKPKWQTLCKCAVNAYCQSANEYTL